MPICNVAVPIAVLKSPWAISTAHVPMGISRNSRLAHIASLVSAVATRQAALSTHLQEDKREHRYAANRPRTEFGRLMKVSCRALLTTAIALESQHTKCKQRNGRNRL